MAGEEFHEGASKTATVAGFCRVAAIANPNGGKDKPDDGKGGNGGNGGANGGCAAGFTATPQSAAVPFAACVMTLESSKFPNPTQATCTGLFKDAILAEITVASIK